MDQFLHIGEVLGSLKALMVLQDDSQINQKQCCLLLDTFGLAFKTIADEIRQQNLRFEDKNTNWKVLYQPLRELCRIFKEGELYIRNCMDTKDWWGKAISLHQNKDSIEFHIHNLLCCFPAVIEAIETAGEISGLNPDEMQKKRFVLDNKYGKDWNDPQLFQWKFGKQYLVPSEFCRKFDSVWREDRWILLETLKKRMASSSTKNVQRLADLLLMKINGFDSSNVTLSPSSILLQSKDYYVKRRLSSGGRYKEIQWLGESVAMRHFFGEISSLNSEISSLLLLSHPNIVQYLCGFYDEEKKECFLIMELMNKDLCRCIKETCGPKRQTSFTPLIVVDVMLQIARGMDYLHSQNIFHGDLNPSNVLIKGRTSSPDGYVRAKVSGFGMSSANQKHFRRSNTLDKNENGRVIWHAPEVLSEQDDAGNGGFSKYTEKADVYSFSMICFELLTGKTPFEDNHLQGDKMSRNIISGERPLFPYSSPKCLVSLTRKCWHSDPTQRPSFSSIVRILRYIKRFLVMNRDDNLIEPPFPPVDVWELETAFLKKFPLEGNFVKGAPIWQIPFQMFAYRVMEKERISATVKGDSWDESITEEAASICGDGSSAMVDNTFLTTFDRISVCSEAPDKKVLSLRRSVNGGLVKSPGIPGGRPERHSPLNLCRRRVSLDTGKNPLQVMATNSQRKTTHRTKTEIA